MSDITLDDLGVWEAFTAEDGLPSTRHRSLTLDELLTVVADAVQPGRLEIVEPCQHWFYEKHQVGGTVDPLRVICPGGSRRIIPTGGTK